MCQIPLSEYAKYCSRTGGCSCRASVLAKAVSWREKQGAPVAVCTVMPLWALAVAALGHSSGSWPQTGFPKSQLFVVLVVRPILLPSPASKSLPEGGLWFNIHILHPKKKPFLNSELAFRVGAIASTSYDWHRILKTFSIEAKKKCWGPSLLLFYFFSNLDLPHVTSWVLITQIVKEIWQRRPNRPHPRPKPLGFLFWNSNLGFELNSLCLCVFLPQCTTIKTHLPD